LLKERKNKNSFLVLSSVCNFATDRNEGAKMIQQLKNNIDHQAVANKHNATVYVYELENGDEVYCFVADLKTTNSFFDENNQRSFVKKFLRKTEPQTTGHHTAYRFFNTRKAANLFIEEKIVPVTNLQYTIDTKETKRGRLHKVTIINLTDEQLKEYQGA
jgi:hypothetical protein